MLFSVQSASCMRRERLAFGLAFGVWRLAGCRVFVEPIVLVLVVVLVLDSSS
jgi:hypothetical protein